MKINYNFCEISYMYEYLKKNLNVSTLKFVVNRAMANITLLLANYCGNVKGTLILNSHVVSP